MKQKITAADFPNENTSETPKNTEENIKEMGSVSTKSPRGNIYSLTVIGQIEGHIILPPQNKSTKYEHVMPQLIAIEEDENIDGLLLILNTVGGDVEAGLAIAEMVASMKKPTISLILGGGHSIGVPLAVSAKHSFIAPSATMTIHPIRMNGTVIGVPQMFQYFDKMQERVISFVTKNSKISTEKFKELMLATGEIANDVGTIIFGDEAVTLGLIDAVGGVSDALSKMHELIDENKKFKTDEN